MSEGGDDGGYGVGVGKISAVTDSGPLIHLTEIGCLQILSIFGNLHVPEAVWAETVECRRTPREDFLKLSNVERHNLSQSDVTRFVERNNLKELHSGEHQCLYLCKQINVPILLTDDLAVREKAKYLNLVPVGSLGIVAKAYCLGQISKTEAERYITALYDVSSLFVTRSIVEMAIEQINRH
jgi:predicted nucleic acid-binding protein